MVGASPLIDQSIDFGHTKVHVKCILVVLFMLAGRMRPLVDKYCSSMPRGCSIYLFLSSEQAGSIKKEERAPGLVPERVSFMRVN